MTSGPLIGHSGYPVTNPNSIDSWASPKNAAAGAFSLDGSASVGTPNIPSPLAPDQQKQLSTPSSHKSPNQQPGSGSNNGDSITIKLQLYGFQNPGSFTSSKYSPDCVLRSEMLEPAKYATMPITFNNVPCDAVQQNAIFSKFLTLPGRQEFLQLLQNMSDCAKECKGDQCGTGATGEEEYGPDAVNAAPDAIRRRFPATDSAINKHWLYNKTDKRAFCFSSRVVLEGNYLASRGSSSGHLFLYLQLFRRHFWVRENLSEYYDNSGVPSIKRQSLSSDALSGCSTLNTSQYQSKKPTEKAQRDLQDSSQSSTDCNLAGSVNNTVVDSQGLGAPNQPYTFPGASSPSSSSSANNDSTFISLVNTLHNQQHHQQRTSCESPSFGSPSRCHVLTNSNNTLTNETNFSESQLNSVSHSNDNGAQFSQLRTSQSTSVHQNITAASSPVFQTCQLDPVSDSAGEFHACTPTDEQQVSLQFNDGNCSRNSESQNEQLISQLKDPSRIRAIEQKQNFLAKQHLNDLAESSIKASSVESSQQVLEKFFRTPAPICSNWDENDEASASSAHNDLVSMVQRKFRCDRISSEETLKINTCYGTSEATQSNYYHLINENNNTISNRNSKHGSKLLKLITDKHGLVSPRSHFPPESPNASKRSCHLSPSANKIADNLASSFANIKQEPLSSKCDQIIVSKSTQIMLNLLDLDKSKFRKKQSHDSTPKNLATNLLTSNTAFNNLAMHPVNNPASAAAAISRNLSPAENEQIPGNLSLPVEVSDSRRRPNSLVTSGCEHANNNSSLSDMHPKPNAASTPSYFNGSGFFQIASALPTVNPGPQQQQTPTSHVPRIISASSQRSYSSSSDNTTANYHVVTAATHLMTSCGVNADMTMLSPSQVPPPLSAHHQMKVPSSPVGLKGNSKKRSRHSSVGPKAKRNNIDHCISSQEGSEKLLTNKNLSAPCCDVPADPCAHFFGGGHLNSSSPLNARNGDNLTPTANDFESPAAFNNQHCSFSRKTTSNNNNLVNGGGDDCNNSHGDKSANQISSFNISPLEAMEKRNCGSNTATNQNDPSNSLLFNVAADNNHNLQTQRSLDDLSLNSLTCFHFPGSSENGTGDRDGVRSGGSAGASDTSQTCENLNDVLFPEFEEFETMISNTDLDLGIESPRSSDNQNQTLHNNKNPMERHLEDLDGGLSLSFSDPGSDDQNCDESSVLNNAATTNFADSSSSVLSNMAQHFATDEEARQALASVDRLLDTEAAKDSSAASGDRNGGVGNGGNDNSCLNTSQDSGVLTEIATAATACLNSTSSTSNVNSDVTNCRKISVDKKSLESNTMKVKHERLNPKVLGNKTLTELLNKGVPDASQKPMEEFSVFAFTSPEELSNERNVDGKEYPGIFLPRISDNKRKIISGVEKVGNSKKEDDVCQQQRAVMLSGRPTFSDDSTPRPSSGAGQNNRSVMQSNDSVKSLENFQDGVSQLDDFLGSELNETSISGGSDLGGYRESTGNQSEVANKNESNALLMRSDSNFVSAPPLSRIKGPREVADELLAAVRQEEERVSLENEQKAAAAAAAANGMGCTNASEMSQTGNSYNQQQDQQQMMQQSYNSTNDLNFASNSVNNEQRRVFHRNSVQTEYNKNSQLVGCHPMESFDGVTRVTQSRNLAMQQISPLAKSNEANQSQQQAMSGASNIQMNMMHPAHSMQQSKSLQRQQTPMSAGPTAGSCEIEYKPFPPNLFRDPVNPPNQVVPNSTINGSKLRSEHNGSQLHHPQLPPQIFVPDHCVNPPPSQAGCSLAVGGAARGGAMMAVATNLQQQQVVSGQPPPHQQTCVNKFYPSSVSSGLSGGCNSQFVYASPSIQQQQQTQQNQTGPLKHDQILGATSAAASSTAAAATMQHGYFHKRFVGTAYQPSVVGGANAVLVPQQRMMLRSPIDQPGAISPVYANIPPHSPHLVNSPTGGFQRFPEQSQPVAAAAHHRQNYHVFSIPPPSLSHHHHTQQQHNNNMSSAAVPFTQRPTDLIGAQNATMVMRTPPAAIPQVFHAPMQQQPAGNNTSTDNTLRKNHLNVVNASMSRKPFAAAAGNGSIVAAGSAGTMLSSHSNTHVNGAINGGLASSNHIINLNSNGPGNVSGACSVISQVMTPPSSRDMSFCTSIQNTAIATTPVETSFNRSQQPFPPQQQPMYHHQNQQQQQNPMQNTNSGIQQPQVSPQHQQPCGPMAMQNSQNWGNVMQVGQTQLSPTPSNFQQQQQQQQTQQTRKSISDAASPARRKCSYDCARPDSRVSSSANYRGSSKKSNESVGSTESKSSNGSDSTSNNKYSEQMEDLNSIYDDILSENSKLESDDAARFNHNFDYAATSSSTGRRNSLFADSPPIALSNFQDNLETMTHQYSRISTEQGGGGNDSGLRNNDGILKTLLCSGNNNNNLKGTSPGNAPGGGGGASATRLVVVSTVHSSKPV